MQEFSYRRPALGTEVALSFVVPEESLAKQISEECFTTIALYENKFSRFLPDSELSLLNLKKHLVVSEEFLAVLLRSRELYRETAGAFNPLLQVASLGYHTDYKTLGTETQTELPLNYNGDFDAIVIDTTTRSVTLKEDQRLDFGGILKGYLAEKISRLVAEKYALCTGNIINLGGDLHTRGEDEDGQAFVFYIYNPVTQKQIPLPLTDTSLATSGTYKRTWQTEAGTKHHIVGTQNRDNPPSEILSASIVNEDGATSEAYTKVLLTTDESSLIKKLTDTPLSYVLITNDGTVTSNII